MNVHITNNRFVRRTEPVSDHPFESVCQIEDIQRTEKHDALNHQHMVIKILTMILQENDLNALREKLQGKLKDRSKAIG